MHYYTPKTYMYLLFCNTWLIRVWRKYKSHVLGMEVWMCAIITIQVELHYAIESVRSSSFTKPTE